MCVEWYSHSLIWKKYLAHTEISIQRTSEMDEFRELVRTKKDVTIICEYLNSHPQVLEYDDVSF